MNETIKPQIERGKPKMLEDVVKRSEPVSLDEILGLEKTKDKEMDYEGRGF